jgi:hypothetical protein
LFLFSLSHDTSEKRPLEAFIFEVQQRPAICDVASDEYSNREKKKNAWEELVNIFIINKEEP